MFDIVNLCLHLLRILSSNHLVLILISFWSRDFRGAQIRNTLIASNCDHVKFLITNKILVQLHVFKVIANPTTTYYEQYAITHSPSVVTHTIKCDTNLHTVVLILLHGTDAL